MVEKVSNPVYAFQPNLANMSKEELVLVAGAGGFIGGHLVGALRAEGYENIRAVDQKPLEDWYQTFEDVENHTLDLKERDACRIAATILQLTWGDGIYRAEQSGLHAQRSH